MNKYKNPGHSSSLARAMPEEELFLEPCTGGFFEITIHYPCTALWLKMSAEKQRKKLSVIFRDAICALPLDKHYSSRHVFEFGKNGQVHLHGVLVVNDDFKHIPVGSISDIVKVILSYFPKKYNKFCTSHLYAQWDRYAAAQCCVQYRSKTETERYAEWTNYLSKQQV